MAPSVLIVCLGNICRSPMGEAVLRHIASERGVELTIDSCGTGAYHTGKLADPRTRNTCAKHGISIVVPAADGPHGGQPHRARSIESNDFTRFDYILAADKNNLQNLQKIKPKNCTADVRLWGSYLDNEPISDPYYDSDQSDPEFEECYQHCIKLSNAFLDNLAG
ncbi:phosphotyrosine protein phosphatase [Athelia psychrophila]|uniref:Phosphotyrosine protein phosphatase n=1 Tax=Athelia psychrophila TaxID=1759441 RepID=A0A165ZG20_9AGAM|nr:phosphotyrosine protein phosphatase [Fibularhizoctonia sp. CBS 109695]